MEIISVILSSKGYGETGYWVFGSFWSIFGVFGKLVYFWYKALLLDNSASVDYSIVTRTLDMEDARLEWIRDRVYNGLNLAEPEIFERFLEEDKNDDVVRKFFSSSSLDETAYAILFYLGTRF